MIVWAVALLKHDGDPRKTYDRAGNAPLESSENGHPFRSARKSSGRLSGVVFPRVFP